MVKIDRQSWLWLPFVVAMLLVSSCQKQALEPLPSAVPSPLPQSLMRPALTPTVQPHWVSVPATPTTAPTIRVPVSSPGSSRKLNLDEIAPPGRGRDLVVENCGACHSFICAFRGQRSIDHWQTIKQDMRDKVSVLNDQDYDALFAYLEADFDQMPEPHLPPEFQDLGCSSGVR